MFLSTFVRNYYKIQVLDAKDQTTFLKSILSRYIREIHVIDYILEFIQCSKCKTYYDAEIDCHCFIFQKTIRNNVGNKTLYHYIEDQYLYM